MTSTRTACFETSKRCLKCGQKKYVGFTQCNEHKGTDYMCFRFDKRTLNQRRCQKCLEVDPKQRPENQQAYRAGTGPSSGPGELPSSSPQPIPSHGQSSQEAHYAYPVPSEAAPYSPTTAGLSFPTPTGHMLQLHSPWGTAGTLSDANDLSTILNYSYMPNYDTATGIPTPTLAAGNTLDHSMYPGFEGTGSVVHTAPPSRSPTPDTSIPDVIPSQEAFYTGMQG